MALLVIYMPTNSKFLSSTQFLFSGFQTVCTTAYGTSPLESYLIINVFKKLIHNVTILMDSSSKAISGNFACYITHTSVLPPHVINK